MQVDFVIKKQTLRESGTSLIIFLTVTLEDFIGSLKSKSNLV